MNVGDKVRIRSAEEWAELETRDRDAAHAIRYLALHVLTPEQAALTFREVQALAENTAVSMDERVVLYEKWRTELWEMAA